MILSIFMVIVAVVCAFMYNAQRETNKHLEELRMEILSEQSPVDLCFDDEHWELFRNELAAELLTYHTGIVVAQPCAESRRDVERDPGTHDRLQDVRFICADVLEAAAEIPRGAAGESDADEALGKSRAARQQNQQQRCQNGWHTEQALQHMGGTLLFHI